MLRFLKTLFFLNFKKDSLFRIFTLLIMALNY